MTTPDGVVTRATEARLGLTQCQRRLAVLWLALVAPSASLLAVQTLAATVWGGRVKDVWTWYLPLVLPTLSLIVGTVARQGDADSHTVSAFAYRLAVVLSSVYLLTVFAVLAAAARAGESGGHSFDVLANAGLFLAPMQVLIGLSLGAFFASGTRDTSGAPKH